MPHQIKLHQLLDVCKFPLLPTAAIPQLLVQLLLYLAHHLSTTDITIDLSRLSVLAPVHPVQEHVRQKVGTQVKTTGPIPAQQYSHTPTLGPTTELIKITTQSTTPFPLHELVSPILLLKPTLSNQPTHRDVVSTEITPSHPLMAFLYPLHRVLPRNGIHILSQQIDSGDSGGNTESIKSDDDGNNNKKDDGGGSGRGLGHSHPNHPSLPTVAASLRFQHQDGPGDDYLHWHFSREPNHPMNKISQLHRDPTTPAIPSNTPSIHLNNTTHTINTSSGKGDRNQSLHTPNQPFIRSFTTVYLIQVPLGSTLNPAELISTMQRLITALNWTKNHLHTTILLPNHSSSHPGGHDPPGNKLQHGQTILSPQPPPRPPPPFTLTLTFPGSQGNCHLHFSPNTTCPHCFHSRLKSLHNDYHAMYFIPMFTQTTLQLPNPPPILTHLLSLFAPNTFLGLSQHRTTHQHSLSLDKKTAIKPVYMHNITRKIVDLAGSRIWVGGVEIDLGRFATRPAGLLHPVPFPVDFQTDFPQIKPSLYHIIVYLVEQGVGIGIGDCALPVLSPQSSSPSAQPAPAFSAPHSTLVPFDPYWSHIPLLHAPGLNLVIKYTFNLNITLSLQQTSILNELQSNSTIHKNNASKNTIAAGKQAKRRNVNGNYHHTKQKQKQKQKQNLNTPTLSATLNHAIGPQNLDHSELDLFTSPQVDQFYATVITLALIAIIKLVDLFKRSPQSRTKGDGGHASSLFLSSALTNPALQIRADETMTDQKLSTAADLTLLPTNHEQHQSPPPQQHPQQEHYRSKWDQLHNRIPTQRPKRPSFQPPSLSELTSHQFTHGGRSNHPDESIIDSGSSGSLIVDTTNDEASLTTKGDDGQNRDQKKIENNQPIDSIQGDLNIPIRSYTALGFHPSSSILPPGPTVFRFHSHFLPSRTSNNPDLNNHNNSNTNNHSENSYSNTFPFKHETQHHHRPPHRSAAYYFPPSQSSLPQHQTQTDLTLKSVNSLYRRKPLPSASTSTASTSASSSFSSATVALSHSASSLNHPFRSKWLGRLGSRQRNHALIRSTLPPPPSSLSSFVAHHQSLHFISHCLLPKKQHHLQQPLFHQSTTAPYLQAIVLFQTQNEDYTCGPLNKQTSTLSLTELITFQFYCDLKFGRGWLGRQPVVKQSIPPPIPIPTPSPLSLLHSIISQTSISIDYPINITKGLLGGFQPLVQVNSKFILCGGFIPMTITFHDIPNRLDWGLNQVQSSLPPQHRNPNTTKLSLYNSKKRVNQSHSTPQNTTLGVSSPTHSTGNQFSKPISQPLSFTTFHYAYVLIDQHAADERVRLEHIEQLFLNAYTDRVVGLHHSDPGSFTSSPPLAQQFTSPQQQHHGDERSSGGKSNPNPLSLSGFSPQRSGSSVAKPRSATIKGTTLTPFSRVVSPRLNTILLNNRIVSSSKSKQSPLIQSTAMLDANDDQEEGSVMQSTNRRDENEQHPLVVSLVDDSDCEEGGKDIDECDDYGTFSPLPSRPTLPTLPQPRTNPHHIREWVVIDDDDNSLQITPRFSSVGNAGEEKVLTNVHTVDLTLETTDPTFEPSSDELALVKSIQTSNLSLPNTKLAMSPRPESYKTVSRFATALILKAIPPKSILTSTRLIIPLVVDIDIDLVVVFISNQSFFHLIGFDWVQTSALSSLTALFQSIVSSASSVSSVDQLSSSSSAAASTSLLHSSRASPCNPQLHLLVKQQLGKQRLFHLSLLQLPVLLGYTFQQQHFVILLKQIRDGGFIPPPSPPQSNASDHSIPLDPAKRDTASSSSTQSKQQEHEHPHPFPILSLAHTPKLFQDMFALASCRGAVKFNQEICLNAMSSIVSALNGCHYPLICAHGRPTANLILPYYLDSIHPRSNTTLNTTPNNSKSGNHLSSQQSRNRMGLAQSKVGEAIATGDLIRITTSHPDLSILNLIPSQFLPILIRGLFANEKKEGFGLIPKPFHAVNWAPTRPIQAIFCQSSDGNTSHKSCGKVNCAYWGFCGQ